MLRIDKELRELIPELAKEEYQLLEESITNDGCRDALVVWGDIIIDGHNRFEICEKHNLPYKTTEMNFNNIEDVKIWMINNQFSRRNLPLYQRAVLALKLKPIIAERAKENQGKRSDLTSVINLTNVDTKKELAKQAGVSHDTIARVEKIQNKAPEEVKEKLKKGEISINQAYNDIKKKEKNEEIRGSIEKQKQEIEQGIAKLPEGVFEIVNIDPPWNYGTRYDAGGRRVGNPYPEMSQYELKELKIPTNDDSILFLWTTHRFIWDAKELLNHWGFEYRNLIVWDKEKIGMGDLFRMQCEFCLVGIKGKPTLDNNHTWRDIIREPRREHSRKPELFYEMVNELCIGRKLDYFSREKREGWEVFGNDTERF